MPINSWTTALNVRNKQYKMYECVCLFQLYKKMVNSIFDVSRENLWIICKLVAFLV